MSCQGRTGGSRNAWEHSGGLVPGGTGSDAPERLRASRDPTSAGPRLEQPPLLGRTWYGMTRSGRWRGGAMHARPQARVDDEGARTRFPLGSCRHISMFATCADVARDGGANGKRWRTAVLQCAWAARGPMARWRTAWHSRSPPGVAPRYTDQTRSTARNLYRLPSANQRRCGGKMLRAVQWASCNTLPVAVSFSHTMSAMADGDAALSTLTAACVLIFHGTLAARWTRGLRRWRVAWRQPRLAAVVTALGNAQRFLLQGRLASRWAAGFLSSALPKMPT